MDENVTVTALFPAELVRQLGMVAVMLQMNRSELVRQAVAEFIERKRRDNPAVEQVLAVSVRNGK